MEPKKFFFSNGKLAQEISYINNNAEDQQAEKRTYYETTGNLSTVKRFDADGNQHGEEVVFDDDSRKLLLKFTFCHGELHGKTQTTYNPSGRRHREVTYDHGRLHGLSTQFFDSEDGQKCRESEYVNGVLHGSKTIFFESTGTPCFKGTYINDLRDGKCTWYHDDGRIRKECMYINGLRHGSCKDYHKNGTLRCESTYVLDFLDGQYTYYYNNGGEGKHVVQFQCMYVNRKRHGPYIRYDASNSGKVLDEGMYANDAIIITPLNKKKRMYEPFNLLAAAATAQLEVTTPKDAKKLKLK